MWPPEKPSAVINPLETPSRPMPHTSALATSIRAVLVMPGSTQFVLPARASPLPHRMDPCESGTPRTLGYTCIG